MASENSHHPLIIPLDEETGISMSFETIPAGSFRMGSYDRAEQQPVHVVTVPEPFFLGTFPVTQKQFAAWKKKRSKAPSAFPLSNFHEDGFPGKPDHPVECVTWFDAMAFCEWLNQEYSPPPGYFAVLPDEARWEYACRAEEQNDGAIIGPDYYTGNGTAALERAGWFSGNSKEETHPVGSMVANRWGLHDMHGNVWEWCLDLYDEVAYRKNAGIALEIRELPSVNTRDLRYRVYRGGSWIGGAAICRSAYRSGGRPGDRNLNQGFRVCLVPAPVEEQKITGKRWAKAKALKERSAERRGIFEK